MGVGRWALGLVIALSVSTSASAQWPQWRGPGGLGISPEKNLPTVWSPAAPGKPAINIPWKIPIPGRGHSSPIVAGNMVFVTTSIKGEEVPGRKAQEHLKFDHTPGYIHPDAVVADSATWAVPVLLPDGLIVRDASGVICLVGQ